MHYSAPVIPAQTLLDILGKHPEGISEYDLISQLKTETDEIIIPERLDDTQALFKLHFLLFHTLYLLRDQLHAKEEGHLEISPLKINLLPYIKGTTAISTHDPLRDYYLDLTELESTSEQDVYDLLASFWTKFSNQEGRDGALAKLGLEDPVDDITIKKRYRELAMQHHPDRGGEKEQLQIINEAVSILLEK
ncbi:MAG: DnaJ domain-containing protein [Gammaproteobacteria bacterium]|nr:DnaJ domain-containing protein [Gammaproteobacteria bacterium]